MNDATTNIPLLHVLPALLPVLAVIAIYARWSLRTATLWTALVRMLVQLFAVGYLLAFFFQIEEAAALLGILVFMAAMASWIALRPLPGEKRRHYPLALLSLAAGGSSVLALLVFGVLQLDPWLQPRYLIPLGGMLFANSMNGLSLAAERFDSDTRKGFGYREARAKALETALLPTINVFFAVGLVSFPGIMTGQILSGTSPLIAVRYQAVIMCAVLGASGLSSALYLTLLRPPKN